MLPCPLPETELRKEIFKKIQIIQIKEFFTSNATNTVAYLPGVHLLVVASNAICSMDFPVISCKGNNL